MMNDKNIIEAIISGDNKKVLNLLYKSSLSKIKRLIITNNGNEDDAKDIFQDAVIILIRQVRYAKFDESKSIDGFLYTVAKNLWINKVKKDKKIIATEVLPEGIDNDDIIESHLDIKERENTINEILNELGEQCAKLLKEMIYKGTDYKEIAVKMGLASSDVVKTYKNRCKKKFVELLNKNAAFRNAMLKHEKRFRTYLNTN